MMLRSTALRSTRQCIARRPLVRSIGTSSSSSPLAVSHPSYTNARSTSATITAIVLAVGGATVLMASGKDGLEMESPIKMAEGTIIHDGKLRTIPQVFLWGRNADLVVSPPTAPTPSSSPTTSTPDPNEVGSISSPEYIKKPAAPKALSSLVLRDLKLSRSYGVALTSTGDVLQWGLGFSSTGALEQTVTGKNLISVEPTKQGKVFGLDSKGQVWVWSSEKLSQRARGVEREERGQGDLVTSTTSPKWWWLGQGTVWGSGADGNAVEVLKLNTDSTLTKGEKFVSISSGESHLLALTSTGRSFALPLCLSANSYGQLGVKAVSLLTPPHPGSSATGSLTVRLEPDEGINEVSRDKFQGPVRNLDPLLLPPTSQPTKSDPTPASQPIPSLPISTNNRRSRIELHPEATQHSRLERSIEFCTVLHEIPSLRGVKVEELVAGRNHSLARLGGKADGRVLGWGAGAYGQLGLGPALSLPSIAVPTEIPLLRSPAYTASKPTVAKCIRLAAGGNLSYFVVETERPSMSGGGGRGGVRRETDLLACGQGQFGGLGNGSWVQAVYPNRVKTVSGLTEWNEATGSVETIGIKDIQAGETHVAVILDNAVTFPSGMKFGRDVFTFGQNESYQLGNGKRGSLSTPQHLPPLPYPSANKKVKKIDENGQTVVVKAEESLSSGTTSPMPHNRLQLATDLPVPAGTRGLSKRSKLEETVVCGEGSTGVYWKVVSPSS